MEEKIIDLLKVAGEPLYFKDILQKLNVRGFEDRADGVAMLRQMKEEKKLVQPMPGAYALPGHVPDKSPPPAAPPPPAVQKKPATETPGLSDRTAEVFAQLKKSENSSQAAAALGISTAAMSHHVKIIKAYLKSQEDEIPDNELKTLPAVLVKELRPSIKARHAELLGKPAPAARAVPQAHQIPPVPAAPQEPQAGDRDSRIKNAIQRLKRKANQVVEPVDELEYKLELLQELETVDGALREIMVSIQQDLRRLDSLSYG